MPKELIYLEFTLPLCSIFLKSSTGGVWNSNGIAHLVSSRNGSDQWQFSYYRLRTEKIFGFKLWVLLSSHKLSLIPSTKTKKNNRWGKYKTTTSWDNMTPFDSYLEAEFSFLSSFGYGRQLKKVSTQDELYSPKWLRAVTDSSCYCLHFCNQERTKKIVNANFYQQEN